MKAIIIAAGQGTRLGKYTEKLPKGLLKINGKTIIKRQIELFHKKKISDISIIVGPHKHKFTFDNIAYIEDNEYEKHDVLLSLMAAKDQITGDVIITYSDILYDENILQQVIDANVEIGIVTDLNWEKKYEERFEHPKEQADNVIIENNQIKKIKKNISDVSKKQINGEFIGIVKFSKKGSEIFVNEFNKVEKFKPSPFHDAKTFEKSYLTDMIQELIDQKRIVNPILIKSNWCEIDTPQDLENAKKLFC
jgi:L-glutamine-phosphate cytidylyltransferase